MPDFLGKVWIQPAAVPDLRRRRFLLIGDFPEKFTSPSQHRSVYNAAQLARGNRTAPHRQSSLKNAFLVLPRQPYTQGHLDSIDSEISQVKIYRSVRLAT